MYKKTRHRTHHIVNSCGSLTHILSSYVNFSWTRHEVNLMIPALLKQQDFIGPIIHAHLFHLGTPKKKLDPDLKVCFLTASEMYHQEVREVDHCALNEDLFLQKPISNEDLLREIDNKINGIGIRLNIKQKVIKRRN
jgi:hypothetical protein